MPRGTCCDGRVGAEPSRCGAGWAEWKRSRSRRSLSSCSLGILTPERADRMFEAAARARAAFGDRTIWHVNATAHGGGVAEMLQTLLAYGSGAGIENRWLVIDGEPDVLRHHEAAAQPPARVPRATAARSVTPSTRRYERVLRREPRRPRSPGRLRGDIVLLHDPQTAGCADGLARPAGARRVALPRRPRPPNDATERGMGVPAALPRATRDAFVFSRAEYAPEWVDGDRLVVIPPSIDPFSRQEHARSEPDDVAPSCARAGLVAAASRTAGATSAATRRLAGPASDRRADSSLDGPPRRPTTPLVRPGEPLGPAQGHGRRDEGLRPAWPRTRPDGRPPDARRAGRLRRDRRPGGRRGARRLPADWRAPARGRTRRACTWPRSRWTTPTRTRSSSTPCSGTPPSSCRRASSRGSG